MSLRRLRLAIFVKEFSLTGGMERYVVEVCRRLAARGHAVDIYARQVDHGLLGLMRYYHVPLRYSFSSVSRAVSFAREATKMAATQHYDIIHSHEKGCGRDIATVHCFSYREGLANYSWLRRIDQQYLSLRSALYLWLERRQMVTPWLVAVSNAIADDIFRQYGRKSGVAVIPPGVDTEVFRPGAVAAMRDEARKKEGVAEADLVVLFVGSEFRRKGLDRLIPAIEPGMRLFVVGRGDDWRYHRQLVTEHGVEGQVHFVGLAADVLRYYAVADVVVLPSRSEAFGMSILEGMACGLPVIASANSGVAALIRHGENGFVMDETTELPDLLHRLRIPEERQRLGRAARATAENHSWEHAATSHEELYHRVIAARGVVT